jgi:hypothetical protein
MEINAINSKETVKNRVLIAFVDARIWRSAAPPNRLQDVSQRTVAANCGDIVFYLCSFWGVKDAHAGRMLAAATGNGLHREDAGRQYEMY